MLMGHETCLTGQNIFIIRKKGGIKTWRVCRRRRRFKPLLGFPEHGPFFFFFFFSWSPETQVMRWVSALCTAMEQWLYLCGCCCSEAHQSSKQRQRQRLKKSPLKPVYFAAIFDSSCNCDFLVIFLFDLRNYSVYR
jgi:hypothetical protein